jgi:hypothetical protein
VALADRRAEDQDLQLPDGARELTAAAAAACG